MKLLLLGLPGSGKGTISEYLINKHNFVHVSTGDIFRNVIKNKLNNYVELEECLKTGKLVDDSLTNKVVKEYLENLSSDNVVLDGYPRTIEQAKFLNEYFNIDKIIYLDIDIDSLTKRIVGRRLCPTCKKIYNIYYFPPLKDGVCDNDNSQLIQRSDDNLETLNTRVANYNENTLPLIDFYRDKIITIKNPEFEIVKKIIDENV